MQIIITIEDGKKLDVNVVTGREKQDLTVGEKTRERRKNLGLRQYELAQLAGVGETTICSIEKGKRNPHASTLELIENALTTAETKNKGATK